MGRGTWTLDGGPEDLMAAEGQDSALEILEARPRQVEAFTVRRVLPSVSRQMVGPFIFFDHMGPASLGPDQGLDVRPHPHIGLATVTYLFEGEILHRDSLGTEQVIRPGAVNWMTAGRGIVHSERSTAAARKAGPRVHALQLWAALPLADEGGAPSFQHFPEGDVPEVEVDGNRVRVIAGEAFGATSPVKTFSSLFYIDARLKQGAVIELPDLPPERAAYVVAGAVSAHDAPHQPGNMIVFRKGTPARLRALQDSRVMLLGGKPLDGERHIWWNFVSSSRETIDKAGLAWKAREFPLVRGDEVEFVPLPERVGKIR